MCELAFQVESTNLTGSAKLAEFSLFLPIDGQRNESITNCQSERRTQINWVDYVWSFCSRTSSPTGGSPGNEVEV